MMWAHRNLYMQTGDVQTGRHPEEQPGLHMLNDPAALPAGYSILTDGHEFFCMHVSIFTLKRFSYRRYGNG